MARRIVKMADYECYKLEREEELKDLLPKLNGRVKVCKLSDYVIVEVYRRWAR